MCCPPPPSPTACSTGVGRRRLAVRVHAWGLGQQHVRILAVDLPPVFYLAATPSLPALPCPVVPSICSWSVDELQVIATGLSPAGGEPGCWLPGAGLRHWSWAAASRVLVLTLDLPLRAQ